MKVLSVIVIVALIALVGCLGENDYDYGKVIELSNNFYKIQRSGKLPDKDVPWRGDTFLDDGQDVGDDLSGGYFDAGDHVKFMFPHAGFTTVINWGIIDYVDGYTPTALIGALETVRWSLRFLLKTHPEPNLIYGQIGDGVLDHSYWGRPEDWPHGRRPTFNISTESPGSELAAEYAAAFASGYMVFRERDPEFAATLLQHARDAFNFSYEYRGTYTDSIPAAKFYKSWSGFGDDLGWAAAWMLRATNNTQYKTILDELWNEFGYQDSDPEHFSWDDKYAGIFVLGLRLTGEQKYRDKAVQFCRRVLAAPRTPKGLTWLGNWGNFRFVSNAAYICLQLADFGVNATEFRAFARQQIGYILGDTGRSYVIGFGKNPPTSPHHRASSCPPKPADCNWDTYHGKQANYYEVTGALVGGPDKQDNYMDIRQEWEHTEVTCDYNAGFQSTLAALNSLKKRELLPKLPKTR